MVNIHIKKELVLEPSCRDGEDGVFNPAILLEDPLCLVVRKVTYPNNSTLVKAVKTEEGFKLQETLISPSEEYDKIGTEDPRITKIDSSYELLYTGYDGKNARIVRACSVDGKMFYKKGVISPNIPKDKAVSLVCSSKYKNTWKKYSEILWDKDACLFPEKIQGKYAMLHRLEPDIQIVMFDSFDTLHEDEFWKEYISSLPNHIVMEPKEKWEKQKIGTGTPPIKTEKGWLVFYHGVDEENVYRAGAALLDLENPGKEIGRTFLFGPEYPWEVEGNVNNVVFPTAAHIQGEYIQIYYGCADKRTGKATIPLEPLLKTLYR